MFRPIFLTVSLIFLTVGAWAKPNPRVNPKSKMISNLLKRCEDGIAVSCYDYGKVLLAKRGKADKRKGNIYVRRACTLAYAPACATRSTVADSKPVKDTKPKLDSQGNPCTGEELLKSAKLGDDGRSLAEVGSGSLWEKSGVQTGDEILSVNGVAYTDRSQVAAALDKGGAVLNVRRNGRETSVMVSCP